MVLSLHHNGRLVGRRGRPRRLAIDLMPARQIGPRSRPSDGSGCRDQARPAGPVRRRSRRDHRQARRQGRRPQNSRHGIGHRQPGREPTRWPSTGDGGTYWLPERALWCSVLELSFGDAVAHVRQKARRGSIDDMELLYAYNFITKWNPTFDAICLLAGIDANWFREQAIKRLNEIEDGTAANWRYNSVDLAASTNRKRKKIKRISLV